jgi:hypothetical protein
MSFEVSSCVDRVLGAELWQSKQPERRCLVVDSEAIRTGLVGMLLDVLREPDATLEGYLVVLAPADYVLPEELRDIAEVVDSGTSDLVGEVARLIAEQVTGKKLPTLRGAMAAAEILMCWSSQMAGSLEGHLDVDRSRIERWQKGEFLE